MDTLSYVIKWIFITFNTFSLMLMVWNHLIVCRHYSNARNYIKNVTLEKIWFWSQIKCRKLPTKQVLTYHFFFNRLTGFNIVKRERKKTLKSNSNESNLVQVCQVSSNPRKNCMKRSRYAALTYICTFTLRFYEGILNGF